MVESCVGKRVEAGAWCQAWGSRREAAGVWRQACGGVWRQACGGRRVVEGMR